VTLGGRRIALFRARGGWFALDAACPHLGGPLADGLLGERSVTCPLHDRRYDLASGRALSGGCGTEAYRVSVVGRDVYVRL
jgi:nitrite reductase (NADH) small subunit